MVQRHASFSSHHQWSIEDNIIGARLSDDYKLDHHNYYTLPPKYPTSGVQASSASLPRVSNLSNACLKVMSTELFVSTNILNTSFPVTSIVTTSASSWGWATPWTSFSVKSTGVVYVFVLLQSRNSKVTVRHSLPVIPFWTYTFFARVRSRRFCYGDLFWLRHICPSNRYELNLQFAPDAQNTPLYCIPNLVENRRT